MNAFRALWTRLPYMVCNGVYYRTWRRIKTRLKFHWVRIKNDWQHLMSDGFSWSITELHPQCLAHRYASFGGRLSSGMVCSSEYEWRKRRRRSFHQLLGRSHRPWWYRRSERYRAKTRLCESGTGRCFTQDSINLPTMREIWTFLTLILFMKEVISCEIFKRLIYLFSRGQRDRRPVFFPWLL